MFVFRKCLLSLLLWLGLISMLWGAEDDTGRERGREVLQAHLKQLDGAERGQITDVQADVLETQFAGCHVFGLRFRQYPVAIAPQDPLKTNNLFVICEDDVVHIADDQQLGEYFTEHIAASEEPASMQEVARAWLLLIQELNSDGFFTFEQPTIEVRDGSAKGAVQVVRQRGDEGELTVRMEFVAGRLKKIQPGGMLSPGIRPRCQASRLLDADPTVREIMRRDLVVMGRACKPYLDEVRKTARPELQRAIDDVWQLILNEGR